MGSVAEFERSVIKERQAEGIARAKARGVYKGRAKVLTDAQVVEARGWGADGVPKAEVARRLGIGWTTLYKYLVGGAAQTFSPLVVAPIPALRWGHPR